MSHPATRSPRIRLSDRYGPPLPPHMIEALAQDWYLANKEAIDAYNAHVRKHGARTESLRTF